MADQGRIQAPDLGITQLGVAPLPGDTYAAPARPLQDNRLGQLADALGAFNGDLKQFGTAYMTAQRYHKDAQYKADMEGAKATVAKYTSPEFMQKVQDGTIPRFATPQAQALVDYTQGQYAAHELGNEIIQKVGTGELSTLR